MLTHRHWLMLYYLTVWDLLPLPYHWKLWNIVSLWLGRNIALFQFLKKMLVGGRPRWWDSTIGQVGLGKGARKWLLTVPYFSMGRTLGLRDSALYVGRLLPLFGIIFFLLALLYLPFLLILIGRLSVILFQLVSLALHYLLYFHSLLLTYLTSVLGGVWLEGAFVWWEHFGVLAPCTWVCVEPPIRLW